MTEIYEFLQDTTMQEVISQVIDEIIDTATNIQIAIQSNDDTNSLEKCYVINQNYLEFKYLSNYLDTIFIKDKS